MKYTEEELAKAIEALIETYSLNTKEGFDKLCEQHPCIEEINLFSADGPVGLGLGKYGGHSV